MYIGDVDDLSDNLKDKLEMTIHLYLPKFCTTYKSCSLYKQNLIKNVGNRQKLLLFICFKKSKGSYGNYHTNIISWNPAQRLKKTITDYYALSYLKRGLEAVAIEDFKLMDNDTDKNDIINQSNLFI